MVIRPITSKSTFIYDPSKPNSSIEVSSSTLDSEFKGLSYEYTLQENDDKPQTFNSELVMEAKEQGFSVEIKPPEKDYKENLRATLLSSRNIYTDLANKFGVVQLNKQIPPIISTLQKIEPKLQTIVLGANGLIYCDIGLRTLLPINIMGDGIIKILSILLSVATVSNGIVLIDEVDNGFHYSSQSVLWRAVFNAAKEFNVQIFATTHSIEIIRAYSSVSEDGRLKIRDFSV